MDNTVPLFVMTAYLSFTFNDDRNFIETFDELPLWSAPFGLFLLKHMPVKLRMTVVDLGSGAGFPLTELAGRLGTGSHIYGVDVWENANRRARQKIKNYGYLNIDVVEANAVQLPFDDDFADLVVSNLGVNNFDDPQRVLSECARVLKPGGRVGITTNVTGHWTEFYQVFYDTLHQLGKPTLVRELQKEENHRRSVDSLARLFADSGLRLTKVEEEHFQMRFADGTSFLNHYFVKVGWLTSWFSLFPQGELKEIFVALEKNLNSYAAARGELALTVPMVYIEGEPV